MNTAEIQQRLRHLSQTQAITPRDQTLLDALRDNKIMSESQIQRLLWPASRSQRTAYNRLWRLVKIHQVLERFPIAKIEIKAAHLAYQRIYQLSLLGQAWEQCLNRQRGYQPKPLQAGHDLLISEIYVQVQLALQQRQPAWRCRWHGEQDIAFYRSPQANRPLVVPDGLVVIYRPERPQPVFSFFLEVDASRASHGRPSSSIGRKVAGYQEFQKRVRTHEIVGELPEFPWVVFVVGREQRMQNLARSIVGHRRAQTVNYALTVCRDMLQARDFLRESIWAKVQVFRDEVIGLSPAEREPLFDS